MHDACIRPFWSLLAALLLAPWALAACGPTDDLSDMLVGAQARAITDGVPDEGHPAVGGLTNGGGICTATLIGWRTVVTAAHCAREGARYFFLLDGVWYRSRSAHRHPGYTPGVVAGTDDIAVVLLERAPPIPFASISAYAPAVGQEVTLVGYGITATGAYDSGVKRIAVNKVSSLNSLNLLYQGTGNGTGNICSGDSGGPAFATIEGREVQVGVHSWGQDPCGTLSASMRVDRYVGWLREVSGGDVSVDGAAPETVDEHAPTLRIIAPEADAAVSSPFALTVELSDDHALAALEVYADGLLVRELSLGGTDRVVTRDVVLELLEGPHQLEAVAVDLLGQRQSATLDVQVHASTSAPPSRETCHFEAGDRWVCPGQTEGCAVTAPTAGLAAWPLLLLASIALRRRRRRR